MDAFEHLAGFLNRDLKLVLEHLASLLCLALATTRLLRIAAAERPRRPRAQEAKRFRGA